MSYELNNDAFSGLPQYGDATFVPETPTVRISEGQGQAAGDDSHELKHSDRHDTSSVPAPDERGEETPLISGARAYEEESDIPFFREEEYYLGQGGTTEERKASAGYEDEAGDDWFDDENWFPTEEYYKRDAAGEEYEEPVAAHPSRTVYVAANYVPDGRELPKDAVVLDKQETPIAAADVPPETPPVEEVTAPSEEPNDAQEIAEKIVEVESIPNEPAEDREARVEAIANVVQDAIDTSKAIEAAEAELQELTAAKEGAQVEETTFHSVTAPDSTETAEERRERIDRVADALMDAALAEAEQRDDDDRDPSDPLVEFVDPSDVTRLGFTAGRVDITQPPMETSPPAEVSTSLQPGETRMLSEDGWQITEHASDYDPTMAAFVNAPVGTALVGRTPETGEGQEFNANSEGCKIVTLWKPEASSVVHIGPEGMDIGTGQIDSVISVEPTLAGPTVEAHVFADVETSPLGEEIAGEQNDRLVAHLRSKGIENITVVSQGRGKDVTLGVRTGRVDAKSADGEQLYTNRPPAASAGGPAE